MNFFLFKQHLKENYFFKKLKGPELLYTIKNLNIVRFIKNISDINKAKQFAGANVECVICGSKYKVFETWNLGATFENNTCFNCKSHKRHRLQWKYLHDKMDIITTKEKKVVLHFAPEEYFFKLFVNNKNLDYIPCDLNVNKFNKSYKTNIVKKIDITKIPLDNNSVDFILCNHILEHIPDDKIAISELYRVMKKGGCAILQVPIDYNLEKTYEDPSIVSFEEREKAFGQFDHVRLYGRDYPQRLKNFDWEVVVDDYVKQFSQEEIFKYGFDENELIYLCIKN